MKSNALSPASIREFLPAALEIEQTPPIAYGRVTVWVIVAVFVFVIVWACVGRVDIVGSAPGKIIPSTHVKTIQSFVNATVSDVAVSEGEFVRAGDLLVLLDSKDITATITRLKQQRLDLHLEHVQVQSRIDALNRFRNSEAFYARVGDRALLPLDGSIYQAKRVQVVESLNEYFEMSAQIEHQRQRNHADRQVIEQQIAQIDALTPLVRERTDAVAVLLKRSLAPRLRWLELREQLVRHIADRKILVARLAVNISDDRAIANGRRALAAKTKFTWLVERDRLARELRSIHQELDQADIRLGAHRLVAPVAGTVQQLNVHTVGGVVSQGQAMMLVVPRGDELRVEARIANKDIGFLSVRQRAEIKIETFPFTKYGIVHGEILTISDDAITDEQDRLVYLAQLSLAEHSMQVDGRSVMLSPGMAVTVEIQFGRRRLIEYLLSPLLRYKREAFQER